MTRLAAAAARSRVRSSRSYHNGSEGFDVTVPPGSSGRYDAYAGHDPDSSPGCGGVTKIPAAWAYAYGPGSAF